MGAFPLSRRVDQTVNPLAGEKAAKNNEELDRFLAERQQVDTFYLILTSSIIFRVLYSVFKTQIDSNFSLWYTSPSERCTLRSKNSY